MWQSHNSTTLYRGRRDHRTNKETLSEPCFPRRPLALSALLASTAAGPTDSQRPFSLPAALYTSHRSVSSLWKKEDKKVTSYELCVTPPVRWRIALCVCLSVCACIEKIAAAEGGSAEWVEKGSLHSYLLRCKCLLEVMVCVITTQLLCDAGWQLSCLSRILCVIVQSPGQERTAAKKSHMKTNLPLISRMNGRVKEEGDDLKTNFLWLHV